MVVLDLLFRPEYQHLFEGEGMRTLFHRMAVPILFTGLGLLTNGAWAVATAFAKVKVTTKLADLDPSDGIAPGLTVLDPVYQSVLKGIVSTDWKFGQYPGETKRLSADRSHQGQAEITAGQANVGTVSISGSVSTADLGLGQFELFAAGTTGKQSYAHYPTFGLTSSLFNSSERQTIVVSAHTSVSFIAEFDISVSSVIPTPHGEPYFREYTTASYDISVNKFGGYEEVVGGRGFVAANGYQVEDGVPDALNGVRIISFENTSSNAVEYSFSAHAHVYGYSYVPEPFAMPLMLSGACVIGLQVIRRRKPGRPVHRPFSQNSVRL